MEQWATNHGHGAAAAEEDVPNAILVDPEFGNAAMIVRFPPDFSYHEVWKLLGGKAPPKLMDIVRPRRKETWGKAVGVYVGGSEPRKHNRLATQILGEPIHGSALMIKTLDDGKTPTKVVHTCRNEVIAMSRVPKATWIEILCAEENAPVAGHAYPTCRVCRRPTWRSRGTRPSAPAP
eukprot:jgi/Mesvir1/2964/Mv09590-RA.1